MTVDSYVNDCVAFAEATKGWKSLDANKFFTTVGNGWEWSYDNMSGGINVAWAFHMEPVEIVKVAAKTYVEEVRKLLEQAIEEGWDEEQLKAILKLME